MLAHPKFEPLPEKISFNPAYLRAKRRLDLAITLLLLPWLCLVMALIALAIWLDSRGPIFFRQTRVGYNGKPFTFLKFRSMTTSEEDTSHYAAICQFIHGQQLCQQSGHPHPYKLVNDQRVTRVGRFIRKTSLDELPQFFHVLRGEMSLVGPRPPLPYEAELYSAHDELRLRGKPGLTGLWQVYGRSRVPFDMMVQMDLVYLQTQSLLFDIQLILRTLPVIASGQGAV